MSTCDGVQVHDFAVDLDRGSVVVAKSQWLILGCFLVQRSPLEGPSRRCPSPGAGPKHDFEQSVNPAHRVLRILRTID
jgi:hypothetical protein